MPNPVTTAAIATANVSVMAAPDKPTTASIRSENLSGLMMCAKMPAPRMSTPSIADRNAGGHEYHRHDERCTDHDQHEARENGNRVAGRRLAHRR